jgi:hypothetical protein
VQDHELFPEVPVVLDRPRRFRIDFNALIAMQELPGLVNGGDPTTTFSAAQFRAAVAAALKHEDPSITPEQVGAWIHAGNLAEVAEAFSRAWRLAMGEGGGDAAPRPLRRAMVL